jgi:hypothetical protein
MSKYIIIELKHRDVYKELKMEILKKSKKNSELAKIADERLEGLYRAFEDLFD